MPPAISTHPVRQQPLPAGVARLMTLQQYQQLTELVPVILSALDTTVPMFWQTLALMAKSANDTGETFYLEISEGQAAFTSLRGNGSCVEMRHGRWYVQVTTTS